MAELNGPVRGLVERDRDCLWHPYTQMQTAPPPLPVVRGQGVYLYLEDGRRVIDGISSWWVNLHGHSHPKINEALARQATTLEHALFAGCTHEAAVALAEQLLEHLPSNLSRVFYSDNGSTAVEVALKMALQYWSNRGQKRTTFLALDHAYHGDTVGAMSASAPSVFTQAFAPMLFHVERAHAPYCYHCPLGLKRETCQIDCLGSLEKKLAEHSERGDAVAGVLIEPMLQGAGGMIVWPAEFLKGVRDLCDRYDTLLIADEVFTGFGRTGKMFACEHAAVQPDLVCLSKGLTAGYLPMGATVVTPAIYEGFLSDDRAKTFFHGHSFTANPLACAVGLASLEIFRTEGVMERIGRLETQLHDGLTPLRKFPHVGDVRVIGGVGAVELVESGPGQGGYLDSVGPRLYEAFLDRGLLLRPMGNVVYFLPPYVITESETAWALEQISEVLAG